MGRQFKSEPGDYGQDPTRFRERVPEPADKRDGDNPLAAAKAAEYEHNLHLSQIDRAGAGKPYLNITDVCNNPGRTSDPRTQHTMPDELPRGGK